MSLSLLIFMATVNLRAYEQLVWFVPVGAVALCYTLAFIPASGRYIRLRDVPYLKLFLIVGVVTYVTTLLPILYGEFQADLWTPNFNLMVLGRALFLFGITLPFDIRDLDFDRNTQLKTIPGKIGVIRTKKLALTLIFAFILAEFIRFSLYSSDQVVFVSLLISGVIAAGFIYKSRPNGSEYFYSLGLEGTMIIQTILVAIAIQV